MTLFRKVFQNQARPAAEQNTVDDASLRRAMVEMKEEPSLLDGDRFDYDNAAQVDEQDVDDPGYEADVGAPDDAETSENEEAEIEDLYGDLLEVEQMEAGCERPEEEVSALTPGTAEASEDDAIQSDEEIAACLGRALAAEGPFRTTEPLSPEAVEENGDDQTETEVGPAQTEDEQAEETPEVMTEHEPDLARFAQAQAPAGRGDSPDFDTGKAGEHELDLSPMQGVEGVPNPAVGRAGRRAGRVKTRLLGFNRGADSDHDPFGHPSEATATAQSEKFPVGWLVIIDGPGVGHAFSIFTGASMIGRGEDQVIRLDFGDNSISRHNHAAIAYDEEQNKFYIGHGGKSNIIRRNARPVLSTEELHHADLIRIGETTLRFVALCGSDFQWNTAGGAHASGA